VISDLSGAATSSQDPGAGVAVQVRDPNTEKILDEIKELEHKGYQFEGADGSFELLARRAVGSTNRFSN